MRAHARQDDNQPVKYWRQADDPLMIRQWKSWEIMEIWNWNFLSSSAIPKKQASKSLYWKNLIPRYSPFAERFIFRRMRNVQWWYKKIFLRRL